MLSQQSIRELVKVIHERYLQARKPEKVNIIDQFFITTGYHRKHASRLLKGRMSHRKGKRRGRKVA